MKLILTLLVTVFFKFSFEKAHGMITNKSFTDEKASFKDFPYLAYINGENGNTCAGTLISHRFVLTAAHCILNGSNSPVTVSLGKSELWEPFAFDIPSKNIITFGGRQIGELDQYNEYHNYDIALIELSEHVSFSKAIQPATLPSWIDLQTELRNQLGKHVGWDINRGKITIKPLSRSHSVINRSTFNKRKYDPFNTLTTKDLYEASGSKTCEGTSGGPLMIDDKVYGVAMDLKQTCACGAVMFTKVTSFLPWIAENTDVKIGLYLNTIDE